jgi:hypothetical protein
MSEYGTTTSGSFSSGGLTTLKTKSDRESMTALRSITATRGSTGQATSIHSTHAGDPWDARMSMEQAQIGVGRIVSIQVAAGEGVRPVPPPKDWPRRS